MVLDIPSRQGDASHPDATTAEAYAETEKRFSHFGILIEPGEADRTRRAAWAADAACVLLGSAHFCRRPVSAQVRIITMIHDTLMSRPNSDLPVVADLGLRRFRSMLAEPDLTEPEMCRVYDALHGMYFAGTTDVRDLRRFDAIVPTVEAWLTARLGTEAPAPELSRDGRLTIAYLIHTGHLDRGNAVTPLIKSLALMHGRRPDRRVIIYLIEYASPSFCRHLEELGIEVRWFPQYRTYDRFDDIALAMRNDRVDVVISEQNRSIGSALFVRRVAPLQMWLDTGFPFWSLEALDWTIAPTRAEGADLTRTSFITWRQTVDTLKQPVDPERVSEVRAGFPPGSFVLGVFVRLIKLDRAYMSFLGRLLASDPRYHLVIAGPGESTLVDAFCQDPSRAGRVTFVAGNVDLNLYGPAIDVMCDTFPFIGGNACREVAVHGTPVVSKLGTAWDGILKADRSPDLLAPSESEYIRIVNRLSSDEQFRASQRRIALSMSEEYSNPTKMIDDVESAIEAAASQ